MPIAYSALYASAMVCCGFDVAIMVYEAVVLLIAKSIYAIKAFAIFEALHGIDAKHSATQLRMQLVEFWLAKSCRTALYHTCDDTAYGIAFSLNLGNEIFHFLSLIAIGTTHNVAFCERKVVFGIVVVESNVAHLRSISADVYTQLL